MDFLENCIGHGCVATTYWRSLWCSTQHPWNEGTGCHHQLPAHHVGLWSRASSAEQQFGTLDGSGDMFRVSHSLCKLPAPLLAHASLQSVLAKRLQIQVGRGASHSIIGEIRPLGFLERRCIEYRQIYRLVRASEAALGLNSSPATYQSCGHNVLPLSIIWDFVLRVKRLCT